MSEKPWYMQLFNEGMFDGEGWWTIKPDGNIVRETIADVTRKLEKELLKENEKVENEKVERVKRYKWYKISGNYEIVLETPGIDDFDYFRFEDGKLNLKYRRVLFEKEWEFNKSLELPVSMNEIDTVDYESACGVTKIVIATKSPEKDIKIVNRNKVHEGGD